MQGMPMRGVEYGAYLIFAYDGVEHAGMVHEFTVRAAVADKVDGKFCHLAYLLLQGHAREGLLHFFLQFFVAGNSRNGGACRNKRRHQGHTRQ